MANPSFLDLKTFVAGQLGNVDQGIYVAKRDSLINIARRKFYSEYEWSFLTKPGTTVLTPSGIGTLPTDFNIKFPPKAVYTYTGTMKYSYMQVDYENLDSYESSAYVYTINKATGQIKTNQPSVTSVLMDYTYIPADRPANISEDNLLEAAPTITAIGYLSISMWWLSKERSTAKFQLFDDKYKEERDLMIKQDTMNNAPKFFTRQRPYIQKGYQSVNNG